MSRHRIARLLVSVMLAISFSLLTASPASATTISTYDQWDGIHYAAPFGSEICATPTYGQTIEGSGEALQNFTFWVKVNDVPVNAVGGVAVWNGSGITDGDDVLWQGDKHNLVPGTVFDPVTFTPSMPIVLEAGTMYVVYATTIGVDNPTCGWSYWGLASDVFAGGSFVFNNDDNRVIGNDWSSFGGRDAAFTFEFVPLDGDGDGVNVDVDVCPDIWGSMPNGCPALFVAGAGDYRVSVQHTTGDVDFQPVQDRDVPVVFSLNAQSSLNLKGSVVTAGALKWSQPGAILTSTRITQVAEIACGAGDATVANFGGNAVDRCVTISGTGMLLQGTKVKYVTFTATVIDGADCQLDAVGMEIDGVDLAGESAPMVLKMGAVTVKCPLGSDCTIPKP